ncbi:MAG: metal ABC transporter permease [Patescibacteria group bacterium]
MILEILQYDFMRRALLAGLITAIVAPTIGIFFVVRRYSAMADTIAHLSLAGVAGSLLAGTAMIPTALGFSILSVLGIERMREKRTLPSDTIVSLFLFGGLALAVVLIGLARGKNVNVLNYLFGSILTVTNQDLILISVIGLITLITTALLWPLFFSVSLDEETAEAHGLPIRALNRTLAVLGAATVAISINIVGVLLIGALMVIPVLTSMKLRLGFFLTWAWAVVSSVISVILGLLLSYTFNLASGGVIVLVAIFFFMMASLKQAEK